MATFNVTVANDDGSANTPNTLSWAIRRANMAGNATHTISIDVPTVNINGVMKALIDSNINIVGNGNIIDGDIDNNDEGFRPFFVLSGNVSISNLTITDGIARGGSSSFGGSGAGMGGALFIYNGTVNLDRITFHNNIANGGSSSIGSVIGGGGLFGDGGYGSGGGLFGDSPGYEGGYGGDGYYGGFGGTLGGGGGFGGGGYGYGDGFRGLGGDGGGGGFGGGGGSSDGGGNFYRGEGGFGGFGGGGGFGGLSNSSALDLGFGGGGGYGGGGFGGGSGNYLYSSGFGGFEGGGGAGMGGAVFIRSGSLTIANSSFMGNRATGGMGFENGQGLGGAIFAMKSINADPSNGNTQGMPTTLPTVTLNSVTFSGSAADDNSNLAPTPDTITSGTDLDTEDLWGNRITRIPPTIAFSADTFSASEAIGTSNAITLIRNSSVGISEVEVSITGGTATSGIDYTDTAFPLTVIFNDTETSKTSALPIFNDNLVEGDETITFEVTSVSNASIGTQSTATFTITDNDTPGFSLSKTTASVSESGSTDSFLITLDAAPLTPVEFAISSDDTGEVTPTATVTLDSGNWNTGATVTLTGQNDTAIDGDQTSTITVSVVDANSDDAFDALVDQTVSVTTTDNDILHGVTVDTTTLTENDTGSQTLTFTVSRTGATTGSSTVNYTIGGTANSGTDFNNIGGTSGASGLAGTVNFAANELSKTITLNVLGDAVDEVNETVSVTLSNPTPGAGFEAFLNAAATAATTTITDDDTAGFSLSRTTASVSENGTEDTVTVVLNSQPTSNVVLSVTSGDTGEVTVSPATLTFTNGSWNTPQTVTLTGVDDALTDGNQTTTVTLSVVDGSSDNAFDPLANQTINVTTTDNDVPGFTLSDTMLEISENGGSDSFTVVLNTQPLGGASVTLPLSLSDTTAAQLDVSELTFTTANWNVAQTVTVTGLDNDVDNSDQNLTIITGNPISTDGDYTGAEANPADVSLTVIDDDTAGFSLSQSSLTVGEDGSTASLTVVLDSQPTADVVLTVTASDPTEATVDVSQLTFTALNWDTPQTVTVTGVDDGESDLAQTSTVTLAIDPALTGDELFDGLTAQVVTITTNPIGPTSFDDVLVGTVADEVIRALNGDDWVDGAGGNDRIEGNGGNDTLNGGLASDTLLGGTGNDRLFGHAGNDRLLRQGGADILLGGEGNDTLLGGIGNDFLAGASGQDFLKGERGADILQGGAGNDTLSGGTGNDTLQGGLGNDVIFTGAGRDVIVTGRGQGFDTVADFTNGLDKLDIGTLRFGQLTIRQQQADVLISVGNQNLLLLQNARANQINSGDLV